jgi:hypothetical protein
MVDAYERVYRTLVDARSGRLEPMPAPSAPVSVPVLVGGPDRLQIASDRRTPRGVDKGEPSAVS